MKIKFFTLYHNNLIDFTNELKKRQKIVFMLPQKYKKLQILNKEEIEYLNYRNLKLFGKTTMYYPIFKLFKSIKKDDTHIIVKHLFQPINFLIFLICKFKKKQLIIYQQDLNEINSKFKILFIKSFFKLITPKNIKAFSVTKQGTNELKKYLNHVKYIPMPIEDEKFSKRKPKQNKKELNILTVGKLTQDIKNHSFLVKSIEKIKQNNPNIKINLTLIGAFKEQNDIYNNLLKITKKSNLDNINIIKNMPYNKIQKEFAKHDLFILPSIKESLGYSIIEAMSAGLPIICSNTCGAKSYIENNKNGYIFNLKKENDLQYKIQNFIKNNAIDTNKINQMSKNNIEIIKNNHDPKTNVEKFSKLLK
ncbi:MAG: glycosyltransferase family 4 protein [Nanoarchaeota archaeon]